jgi:DNA-binding transcriptional LysR family regulator
VLAPHIDSFLALYPNLTLDIVAMDQLGDLIADGFDVAIRFGAPPSSSLVARKLLKTRTVLVASPAYLARYGRPAHPRDLLKHVCIQVRDSLTGQPIEEWEFSQGNKVERVRTSGRLMVAEFGTMLEACLAGVGIARVKAIGIQRLVAQGALAELLPDWLGDSFPLYALYASRHLPPAKVRAFIDFVHERLVENQPTTSLRSGHRQTKRVRLRRSNG